MLSHTRSRVLCVDDDEDACEMLSVLLRTHEIDATCVRSAAAAWQKINAENFDLYLLDSWMPSVDGVEFCRQLRALDANTPILFYSGAAYESDRKKGMAAGANAYVIKPDVERLIETMLDLIVNSKANTVDVALSVAAAPFNQDLRFSPKRTLQFGPMTNLAAEV